MVWNCVNLSISENYTAVEALKLVADIESRGEYGTLGCFQRNKEIIRIVF